MANVVDILVKGKDQASHVFKKIEKQAEQAFDEARRSFNRLENDMRDLPNVDLDTGKARAEIKALKAQLDALEHNDIEIKVRVNTNHLLASVAALAPTLSPVLASATAGILALGTAFATAGIGAVAFAAVAAPALKRVFNETKNLTKKEQEAQKALKGFQSFWRGFAASFRDPILDIFINSLGTLQTALVKLKPTFAASIDAVSDLMDGFDKAIRSSEMQTFFDWLGKNVGPTMRSFGVIFGNVMQGVANLMMAFGPLSKDMMSGLEGLTKRFANWTAQLSQSKGFQNFINYVRNNGPVVMSILGELARLITNLLVAMAPLGQKMLEIANNTLEFTSNLLESKPAVAETAVAIAALAGAVPLLATPISALVGFVSTIGGILAKAGAAIAELVQSMGGLRIIASVGGWITLAIGLLTLLYTTSARFASFVNGSFKAVWQSLKQSFATFAAQLEPIKSSLSALGAAFTGIWVTISPLVEILGTILVGALVVAGAALSGLVAALGPIINAFVNAVTAVVRFAEAILKLATGDLPGAYAAIQAGTTAFIAVFISLWQGLVNFFTAFWATLVQVAAAFGVNLKSVLVSAFNSTLTFIVGVISGISSAVVSGFQFVLGFVRGAISGIRSTITSGFNIARSAVTNAISGIRSVITSGFNAARSIVSSVISSIRSTISSGFAAARNAVSNAASSIRSILSGLASQAYSWGSNLISMFGAGVRSKIGSVVAAARNAAAQIKSYLGFSSPTEKGAGSNADHWAPNLMQMYAGGIESGLPKIRTAVSNAADETSNLGRPSISGSGSDSGSSSVVGSSPTINIYEAQRTTDKEVLGALRKAAFLYG